ncbi:winged helix-turn-helix domain-containing protein [uncultured Schumannella sp.]|uniref:winged helix-turn-helix domain-containing protein n=1 Tax=uncultured Schumannella sp. TaxID=1195956 RepID=UPI0025D49906|nr:crosslink repair DNA glycosylase YcaQ family protein [uncultured Schumannella sp.]
MPDSLSLAAARRIALAAQGFGTPRPAAAGTRQLNLLLDRLGILQIDSVNVLERSHYLPVFARLGGYDKALLDRITLAPKARYLEYWAHVAAFVPAVDWPLWRWRMDELREKYTRKPDAWANTHHDMLTWVRAELAANGPMAASAMEHDANVRRGPWWGWSDVKEALEQLFMFGEVATAGRRGFERVYALPEQVVAPEVLETWVSREDAQRELVARAARAHGIGTVKDLADYYRLSIADTSRALHELEEAGTVSRVAVEGWGRPAFLHREARIPRRIEATALLSPFDPVVWERDRALRLFDFHYRIEIYTPAAKRVYGYYTLPVLVDDRLVGRIDLKNDRQARVLRVQSAWREPHAPVGIEERIAPELRAMAAWQGCESIVVVDRGDLARDLAGALGVATVSTDERFD